MGVAMGSLSIVQLSIHRQHQHGRCWVLVSERVLKIFLKIRT
jgi:hypothetical protein